MGWRGRPPPASADGGSDLDSTAELPVLDGATPAASATTTAKVPEPGTEEQLARTDTWAVSPAARAALSAAAASAEEQRQLQHELQSRTKALQDAEERLVNHAKRLLHLEQARDEALVSQAAAVQRAASAEQRASAAEQRTAWVEKRLAELEQRGTELSAELAERRGAAPPEPARPGAYTRPPAPAPKRAAPPR